MEDEVDEEVPTCPLCLEELDATDRAVKACQCGYQVCLWCLHTIRERLNRRCPACRTPYDEHNFKIDDLNPEQAAKEAKERQTAKKERERREKLKEIERERARALVLSQQKAKSNLKHARILQKNLVYVIGLSLTLAREEVIRRPDMFGRFGRIIRTLVNRSHPFNSDAPGGPSISAYVQYARDVDASSAVRSMSNAVYDGREIRCAIATTKYCDALLRNAQVGDSSTTYHCGNPMCMYYHSTAHSDLVLTKDEVLARQLGPPPSAHLFETASSRRATFNQSYPRSASSPHSQSQGSHPPANRSASRTHTNVVANSQPPYKAKTGQDTSQLPASQQLPTLLQSTSPTPIDATSPQGYQAAPSPQRANPTSPDATARSSKASPTPSPRQSSPSSSSEQLMSRQARSPEQTTHSHSSSPTLMTGYSAPVPLPSSATWASTQPGHPVSRSPTRRIRPSVGENARSRPPGISNKADVPPGFEDASFAQSPPSTAPIRPPGFDGSPVVSIAQQTTVRSSLHDSPVRHPEPSNASDIPHSAPVQESSPNMSRPPGFSPSTLRFGQGENPRDKAAVAWLQEASTDAVFSSNEDRGPIRPVGDNGIKPVNDTIADNMRPRNLQQVLSTIGGTLGVSSEIHNVQPPVSAQFESNVLSQGLVQQGMGIHVRSHLNETNQTLPTSNTLGVSKVAQNRIRAGMRIGSFPNDLDQELKGEQNATALPSHTSVPSHLSDMLPVNAPVNIVRTAMALRGMRSRSRFTFAQDEAYESGQWNTGMVPRRSFVNEASGREMNPRAISPADLLAMQYQENSKSMSHVEQMDSSSLKRPSVNTRQMRSRFDFADYGSSPPRDPGALALGALDVRNPTGRPTIGVPLEAQPIHGRINAKQKNVLHSEVGHGTQMNEDYTEQLNRIANEAKLGPSFSHSMKWTNSNIPHQATPNFELHPHEVASTTNPSPMMSPNVVQSMMAAHRRENPLRMNMGNNRTVLRAGSDMGGVNTNEHVEVLSRLDGGMTLPPPGFKQATSGISPDTIAGVQSSANTGVAATVVSGGVHEGTRTMSINTGILQGSSHEVNSTVISREMNSSYAGANVDLSTSKIGADQTTGSIAKKEKNESRSTTGNFVNKNTNLAASNRDENITDELASSETESAEDERKRSRAQRKRDRKARQARENVGRERKIAKEGRIENKAKSQEKAKILRDASTGQIEKESKSDRREVVSTKNAESSFEERNEVSKRLSVSELEKEVEAARVREAQLKDKLMEITRRLRSYDNSAELIVSVTAPSLSTKQ